MRPIPMLTAVLALCSSLAFAQSTPTITEYPTPTANSFPEGVTAGPDGALWFVEYFGGKIGRITTAGTLTEFVIPTGGSFPQAITAGPDGALWFTETSGNKIGRVTTTGSITEYATPASASPLGITAGSDGALWFTEPIVGKIGRITTSGAITEYAAPWPSFPFQITGGPDGALWFTDYVGQIGRITTNGSFSKYATSGNSEPQGITVGPDGALWFVENFINTIGRMTTSGVFSEYEIGTPFSRPTSITVGPDGALWFAESGNKTIGRMTTTGSYTAYPTPAASGGPFFITTGPDGSLWFSESYGSDIARLSLSGATAPSVSSGQPPNGEVAFAYSATLGASGGAPPYGNWTVVSGSLPPGLSLNPSTGIVSGIPTSAGPPGTFYFSVTVNDSTGATSPARKLSIDVAPMLQITGPTSLYSGIVGVAYLRPGSPVEFYSEGGWTPQTWSATGLPNGMSMNAAGVLSGAPGAGSQGTYQPQITVQDAIGAFAILSIRLIINATQPGPVQVLSSPALRPGTVGTFYSQSLTAIGGTPPYTWWVWTGSLPAGLSLSPNGSITGISTMVGTSSFNVMVTDSDSGNGGRLFSTTVNQLVCSNSLSASRETLTPVGGSVSIAVNAAASCIWNVSGLPPWVTVTSGASGTGNGSVVWAVAENNTGAPRSATLTVGSASFTMQQLAPAISLVGLMPHLAAEGGWNTTFTLIDKFSASVEARAGQFDDNGNPLTLPLTFPQQPSLGSTTEAYVDQTVAANALLMAEASGPANVLFVEGSTQVSGTGAVDGFAIFHFDPTQQEAVVPLETRNAPSYLLAFDNTNSVVTGVAIENVSASSATIPVIIRDDNGIQIATEIVTLPANGHTSFVLPTQYLSTANARGTVEFDAPAGAQISVLGIRYTPPGTLTTIPALANVGTGGGLMAHLALGAGWQTTLVLVNTGPGEAQATLNFFDDNGNALPLPSTFLQTGATSTTSSVAPYISAGASLWLQTLGPLSSALLTGSAQLTTNGDISGYAIFRYNPNGQEAVVPLETRNASSYLLAFDNTNGITTGLAISAVSAQVVNVPVILRNDAGTQIGTGTIPLAANGHYSQVLATLFPETANIRGMLEFDTPAGAEISVLGIRSPPALTFTTLPPLVK